jgi:hypothetical protein
MARGAKDKTGLPAVQVTALGKATRAENDEQILESWLANLTSPHSRRNFEVTARRFLAELPAGGRLHHQGTLGCPQPRRHARQAHHLGGRRRLLLYAGGLRVSEVAPDLVGRTSTGQGSGAALRPGQGRHRAPGSPARGG